MECLGGNGYVEESMLPLLYREAPVNAIWEGSGNVMCLDVLRALGRVLIEIVGAEHRTGIDILIITGAILLLSFAVLVLRFGSYKYPSERPAADLAR